MRCWWLLALLIGCDGGDTGDTDTGVAVCDTGNPITWAGFGDGFFRTYCRSCHSEDTPYRFDAPEGIDFDTLDQVRMFEQSIRITTLSDESMPVGGGVLDEDLERLEIFLDCWL